MDISNLSRVDCNTLRVYFEETDITYHLTIKGLDDSNAFTVVLFDETIISNTEYTYNLTPDGIYEVTIGEGVYYVYVTCDMRLCMLSLIQSIICGCCEHDDCKTDLHYKFIEVDRLWRTYMSLMSEAISGFVYDTDCIIDYSSGLDILQMNKIIKRITELCGTCEEFSHKCKHC